MCMHEALGSLIPPSPSQLATTWSTPKVHEAAEDADWRHNRYNTQQFLEFLLSHGRAVSPIFSVFGVFSYLFRIDWLHAVDQGVGADFLGNLFALLVSILPGRNREIRTNVLWQEMQAYYDAHGVEDTLGSFNYKNIKGSKRATIPPKLRSHAAGCRALIRFGHLMAEKYLSDAKPIEYAAKNAAFHLWQCYQSLSHTGSMYRKDVFEASSKAFALQYHALFLAVGDGVSWRVMPKMHLFLELCCEDTEPNLLWCYRDEDFGGSVAKQAEMRGMWKNFLHLAPTL